MLWKSCILYNCFLNFNRCLALVVVYTADILWPVVQYLKWIDDIVFTNQVFLVTAIYVSVQVMCQGESQSMWILTPNYVLTWLTDLYALSVGEEVHSLVVVRYNDASYVLAMYQASIFIMSKHSKPSKVLVYRLRGHQYLSTQSREKWGVMIHGKHESPCSIKHIYGYWEFSFSTWLGE